MHAHVHSPLNPVTLHEAATLGFLSLALGDGVAPPWDSPGSVLSPNTLLRVPTPALVDLMPGNPATCVSESQTNHARTFRSAWRSQKTIFYVKKRGEASIWKIQSFNQRYLFNDNSISDWYAGVLGWKKKTYSSLHLRHILRAQHFIPIINFQLSIKVWQALLGNNTIKVIASVTLFSDVCTFTVK